MALNFEGLEMQKCNIPTERAQREDKKNVVICLIIMFTPRIAVIIVIKGLFFYISRWWQQNSLSQFGQNI